MVDMRGPRMPQVAMPKRSSKPKKDVNQLAASIVQAATGESGPTPAQEDKNPAAVALGRLGGLKGGKARARALSAYARARIAKMAARARWKKKG